MAKQKQATGAGASAPVVLSKPPKGAARVTVRVRRTGRTMRMSAAEARALHAIKVVDFVEPAPVPVAPPDPPPLAVAKPARGTYQRRDMVPQKWYTPKIEDGDE